MVHFQHTCDTTMQSEPFQQKRQPGSNMFDALPIEVGDFRVGFDVGINNCVVA
jgi:hypothetical protein